MITFRVTVEDRNKWLAVSTMLRACDYYQGERPIRSCFNAARRMIRREDERARTRLRELGKDPDELLRRAGLYNQQHPEPINPADYGRVDSIAYDG